jgi:hypothetical protein
MKFTYASGDRPLKGFTIQHGIGRGGFGEVYQAVSDGGKEVALKLVQRNWEVELRGVGQCLNLKHPNLVSLYDVIQAENGDSWVVMECVTGETLDKVIAQHPQGLPPEEALRWLRGICAGIAHLHDCGIVHRDLKPSNIFLENGVVKIGDYGLSKFISASRRSGQTGSVGTVHYMAPELVKGRYGKEVDLYALGIILYEMLTGRVPFDGESPGEILMKHLTAEPEVSGLPSPYREVVARLLEKDPQRRYPSVAAMLVELNGSAPVLPITEVLPPKPQTGGLRVIASDSAWAAQRSSRELPAARPNGEAPNPWQSLGLFVVRLAIAVAIGVGTGFLAYGVAGEVWRIGDPRWDNAFVYDRFTGRSMPDWEYYQRRDAAELVGGGAGLLAGGLAAFLLCFGWSAERSGFRSMSTPFGALLARLLFGLTRLAVAITTGIGGVLLAYGIAMGAGGIRGDTAEFMAIGAGFLVCGIIAYWLFFGGAFTRPFAYSGQGCAAPVEAEANPKRDRLKA